MAESRGAAPLDSTVDSAIDVKRAAILSAVSTARMAHAEEAVKAEERRQRKLKAEDLFGSDATKQERRDDQVKDKTYRMQGEFGQKKFIKP